MAKQNDKGYYVCKYCGNDYKILPLAIACEESHEIIYVPIPKEQLHRLLQLFFTQDWSLIQDEVGQKLVNILTKYKNKLIVESKFDSEADYTYRKS